MLNSMHTEYMYYLILKVINFKISLYLLLIFIMTSFALSAITLIIPIRF